MYKTLFGAMFAALLLVGCATTFPGNYNSTNDYSSFYQPTPGMDFSTLAGMRANPAPAVPRVVRVARSQAGAIQGAYLREGYVLVGQSSFTSGHLESDQDAVDVGTNVGADLVVILNPEYVGTANADVPVTVPTTTTSYSTGTAVSVGGSAPGMAYGNSTTTTYGNRTLYMPIAAQRYAYGAGYFVKRHYLLGVMARDLNYSELQELQSNSGVYVTTVIENTPAYANNVLPGDFIVDIDGQAVVGQAGLWNLIEAHRGHPVTLTIVRAGKTISKQITLDQ